MLGKDSIYRIGDNVQLPGCHPVQIINVFLASNFGGEARTLNLSIINKLY